MSEAQSDLRDALPVGTVVGEYEVEALLGHGGYSVVYRARHVELGQLVALKEYLPADLSVREGKTVFPRSTECAPHYEDGKRRFLEEAKRIVEFKDDPGVVACLGFFRANGTAYLVLEHVDGMSLAELLRQREAAGRPLDESEFRSLVLPLLETLSRLHEADVLHRDIKPSNILVRRLDGSPVLIDFGAAKQQAVVHSKSIAPFTEGYAALEQVGEGKLGPWTDVYAIGAVMWRIVAGGRPPWEPPNPKKVELRASAILAGKGDPLPSAVELGRGRFSPILLASIDKCLRIQEDDRARNCGEICKVVQAGNSINISQDKLAIIAEKTLRKTPRSPTQYGGSSSDSTEGCLGRIGLSFAWIISLAWLLIVSVTFGIVATEWLSVIVALIGGSFDFFVGKIDDNTIVSFRDSMKKYVDIVRSIKHIIQLFSTIGISIFLGLWRLFIFHR